MHVVVSCGAVCCRRTSNRDLNTNNVLVYSLQYDQLNVRIADFGLSREMVKDTSMTGYLGSPSYIAPEILTDSAQYDETVDVYSYGIILWTLVKFLAIGNLPVAPSEDQHRAMMSPYPGEASTMPPASPSSSKDAHARRNSTRNAPTHTHMYSLCARAVHPLTVCVCVCLFVCVCVCGCVFTGRLFFFWYALPRPVARARTTRSTTHNETEMSPWQIVARVKEGMRPTVPRSSPCAVLERLMGECWAHRPRERPSFAGVLDQLEEYDVRLRRPRGMGDFFREPSRAWSSEWAWCPACCWFGMCVLLLCLWVLFPRAGVMWGLVDGGWVGGWVGNVPTKLTAWRCCICSVFHAFVRSRRTVMPPRQAPFIGFVTDRLFVGGLGGVRDSRALRKHRITHVLNVAGRVSVGDVRGGGGGL